MPYFNMENFGGLKLRNNKGYFNTQTLPQFNTQPPPLSPYPTFAPNQPPTGTTGTTGTTGQRELPEDPNLDTQSPPTTPPPTTPPSDNPYTQKQQNYRTAWDAMSAFQPQIKEFQEQWLNVIYAGRGHISAHMMWEDFVNNIFPAALKPIQDTLASYGFELNTPDLSWDVVTRGVVDLNSLLTVTVTFESIDELPKTMSFNDAVDWIANEITRLGAASTQHDTMAGFMEQFQNWAMQFEAGKTQVDPFADPNGWGALVKDVFGDMADLPNIQDLMMGMYDLMPVWNYTANALPNLTAEQRMTKFFDDLKANGFNMEDMQSGLDQQLRDWLYKMAQELQPSRMFEQLDLDLSTWNKMTNAQIAEITKMIGRKSVFDDDDTRKYLELQMRNIKNINKEEYNRTIGILAEKGIAHGGAVVRSAQELSQRMNDAEMTVTSELFMRGVELAEQGRWEAMKTWSGINDTQAELLLNIGGLKATLFGQYFSFLQGIGSISASEFSTKTEAYVAKANLELKYNLGVAGLEVDKYISDRGLDLEGLKLEYDNYWRDRGADLTEKQAEFDNAIAKWQTSSMMAEMVNSGRTERLVQMADLALKAQSGDVEAWGMYQQLALQERIQERGMDIEQAQAMADLTFQYYTFGETMDFNRWAIQYEGLLKKELLRMNIQGQKDLARLQADLEDDGFFGAIINMIGGFAKFTLAMEGIGLPGGDGDGWK